MPSPPIVLTVAGSDSSGGAGLQADLKTFAAHGVYGVCAATALVAQVPGAVASVRAVDAALLSAQLQLLESTFPLSAMKTGMLADAATVAAVAGFARRRPALPLVLDPVTRASAGTALLTEAGFDLLCRDLLPLARLVTPNLPEAERLLGEPIRTPAAFAAAPRRLHERFGCDVLLKGGHVRDGGATVSDHAWIDGAARVFERPRLDVPDVHGTGCTLSAAIAARLALGRSLGDAIESATRYLAACLAQHFAWPPRPDGAGGIEALNHFPDGVDCARP